MIQLSANAQILVAVSPQDFRKGIDGFAYLCHHELNHDPKSGCVFAFINRSKTMVRLLVYEQNGYWLMSKRLSKGKFKNWPTSGVPVSALIAKQLRQLLRNENTLIKRKNLNNT